MRLDKFLTLKNLSSRRNVNNFINCNSIFINGKKAVDKKTNVNYDDLILINETIYHFKKYYYYIINKPENFICSNIDEQYPSILNILKKTDFQNDLFCVGRLDVDTTGLLLITNDGQFSHQLLSPKKHILKTYEVDIIKKLDNESLFKLENGIQITNEHFTKKAKVSVLSEQKILLTISEGKYHQVKLMLLKVGNQVLKLKRIKFGNYNLDDLKLGEYKSVEKK